MRSAIVNNPQPNNAYTKKYNNYCSNAINNNEKICLLHVSY